MRVRAWSGVNRERDLIIIKYIRFANLFIMLMCHLCAHVKLRTVKIHWV